MRKFGLADQAAIAQAMISEIVDGAVLAYVFSEMLRRQGYRILAEPPSEEVSR